MTIGIKQLRSEKRTLEQAYPNVAKEWNYDLNIDTPYDIAGRSKQKRWFTCEYGHIYDMSLDNRAKGKGCGYCSGARVGYDNNLSIKNPDLAKQWHKDNEMKPNEVTPYSNQKVKWICKNNHVWYATIANRNNGKDCAICISGQQTSKPEKKLRQLLKGKIKKIAGYPVDAVVGNWVIQYDGSRHHRNRYEVDVRRTNAITKEGYKVIRVRVQDKQYPLKNIPNAINIPFDVKDERKLNLDDLVSKIKEVMA